MTEAQWQSLSRPLQRAASMARHRIAWYLGSFGAFFLLFCLLVHFIAPPVGHGSDWLPACFFWASILAICPMVGFSGKFYTETVEKLASCDDVRALGPLADALSFRDSNIRYRVRPGLLRLLRSIKASDAALLTSQQRDNLRRLLTGADIPVILALLTAYQQIGDARDRQAVQNLLKGKGDMARDPQVRQAALECLPFLEAHIERSKMNDSLLRPSDPAPAQPTELLRSVSPIERTDPQQLLRSPTDQPS